MRKSSTKQARRPVGRKATQASSIPRGIGMAYSTPIANSAPRLRVGDRCTRVTHREFIGDVPVGTKLVEGVWTITKWPSLSVAVNPGVPDSFPWLSDVANRFELYRFENLRFDLISRVSTITVGSWGICFDADANDPPPVDRQMAMSYRHASADNIWKDLSLVIGPDLLTRFARERYTRRGDTTVTDLKTYDVGNVYVFTAGTLPTTSTDVIGELYVTYDVVLIEPQTRSSGSSVSLRTITENPVGPPTVSGQAPFALWNDSVFRFGGKVLELFEPDGTGQGLRFKRSFEGLLNILSTFSNSNMSTLPDVTLVKPTNVGQGAIDRFIRTLDFFNQQMMGGKSVIHFAIKALAGDTLKMSWSVASLAGLAILLGTGTSDSLLSVST